MEWEAAVATVRELRLRHARVTLILGEPIDHPREALYAAVNARGVLASGFGGAIRIAGGGEIERELRGQAPLLVGEAYLTGPGRLAARGVARIVFGVTTLEPGRAPRRDAAVSAIVKGLDAADQARTRSLTLPEIATRVEGLSLADAADLLIDALAARLRRGSSLDEVVIAGLHADYLRRCRDALIQLGATAS
jgi:O-acetyl-ADP-ribose deacetylase (regulator of RNase III)